MLPAWNPGAACHAYCASTTPATSQAFFPSGKVHQACTGSGGLAFLPSKDTPRGCMEAGPLHARVLKWVGPSQGNSTNCPR